MKTKIDWLAIRPDGLSFIQCLFVAFENPEIIKEFDRLKRTNLTGKGTPLELAIDEASGKLEHDIILFAEFIWESVFIRI